MKKIFKKSFLGIVFLAATGLNSCLNLTKEDLTQYADELEGLANPLFGARDGVNNDDEDTVIPITPINEGGVIDIGGNPNSEAPDEEEGENEQEEENQDPVQTPNPNQNEEPGQDQGNEQPQTPAELLDAIDLSETSKELFVGEHFELVASIYPAPLQNEVDIFWESDNATVASVNDGYVTANNYGQANITARVEGNNQVIGSCLVNVYNRINSISFENEVTLTVGGEYTINYTLNPSVGLKNNTVSYQVANTSVARVVSGKIRALSEGTTSLTIRSNQDSTVSTMCNIVVNPLPPKSIDEIYDMEEDSTGYVINWLNEVSEEVTLPSEFNGKPVYGIEDLGFDAASIRVLRMPSSYTYLSEFCQCFRQSETLETFIFSDNITSIPEYFFQACYNLTKVYLPRNLESVGDCAFDGTGITDIYFGGSENEYKYLNTNASNGNSILLYQNPSVTVHYNASPDDVI